MHIRGQWRCVLIESLLRKHLISLEGYKCARDEADCADAIYLDANENCYDHLGGGKNRYPDPKAVRLREEISSYFSVPFENIAVSNGSDEMIDMLIRLFCTPGEDKVMIFSPTYGEYKVFSLFNAVDVVDIPLKPDFSLDVERAKERIKKGDVKIVFITNPNNPTGMLFPKDDILEIADANPGITVIDEAYAEFAASYGSLWNQRKDNRRIVILKTMSKFFSLASSRVGFMFADEEIVDVYLRLKAPYNVSLSDQEDAIRVLSDPSSTERDKDMIIKERERLIAKLEKLSFVIRVFPSEANFVLVKVKDAYNLYSKLLEKGIIVRNRSKDYMLENTIRITIGKKEEMDRLMEVLDEEEKSALS